MNHRHASATAAPVFRGPQPGIVALLKRHRAWLDGSRIGVLSHQPAIDPAGNTTAARLAGETGLRVTTILGPEHGFFGAAGAGELTGHTRHPSLRLPLYSLYGDHRKPTARMLRDVDVIVHDLQDLGARPYTYVSTLRLMLEAAAELGKRVVIADRAIPLPAVVDGPMAAPALASFVAAIPAPMLYGMTPGETARWLRETLALDVDLRVARLRHFTRTTSALAPPAPWIPPSPGIVSWESAACYTATVFCEALPFIDNGRNSGLSFQVLGAPWLRAPALLEALADAGPPGVAFHAHRYVPRSGTYAGECLDGIRLTVTDALRFRPIALSIHLLGALDATHRRRGIWRAADLRADFFDKLYGTADVRLALADRVHPARIIGAWRATGRAFVRQRRRILLY